MARKAAIKRKTTETDIIVELDIDGAGKADVKTPIPFFTHMLSSFAKHGLFDLKLRAKGDIEVDLHHTVEDAGLCLGEAVKKAAGSKAGIVRVGTATVPMMDSLATVVLDLSGRPYFKFNAAGDAASLTQRISPANMTEEGFDFGLVQEFMTAFSSSAGIDLHVTLHYGRDIHHSIEAVYKALGRALGAAVLKDKRIKGVMSTKGKL
ncbi:MAG: imidazoleglycerol-phosphate dehydratase HisB [Deltaproteobacteria bacterium]|nr:imidazoleglycerol-phosphate dehydratase HisB [Deltaproteobacteria bacterium]